MSFGAQRSGTLLVGETMLAAVFVEIVASMIISIASETHTVLSMRPIRLIGSDIDSPTSSTLAAVSTTPSPAEQQHGQWQPQDLADDLAALRTRVAAEIGDVQRQRRPEADHCRQRRHEVCRKRVRPRDDSPASASTSLIEILGSAQNNQAECDDQQQAVPRAPRGA